ncbi:14604_t:CDS:2, partial [Acaulospora colombiana]
PAAKLMPLNFGEVKGCLSNPNPSYAYHHSSLEPSQKLAHHGSVVAMVGKNCVAIASDLRLGNQALTIATNFEK